MLRSCEPEDVVHEYAVTTREGGCGRARNPR
jgi:hypothetical protein